VLSKSRIHGENWIIDWIVLCSVFTFIFNIYIRSMYVKLLQTTFSDSHRPRRMSRSRCINSFQSFSEFPNLSLFIIPHAIALISFHFAKTTSGEIRLWLMQSSFLCDRLHACVVPNQFLVKKREIGFEFLLLFLMYRESIHIMCVGKKSGGWIFFFQITSMPSILYNSLIIKAVWWFGSELTLILSFWLIYDNYINEVGKS